MNKLLIKGRKALAITASVLALGLVAQIITAKAPIALVQADQGEVSIVSTENISQSTDTAEIKVQEATDVRVLKIHDYLAQRNAPLADYAKEFVKAADNYGIDYRLVAAISVIESGGGVNTFKAYNAWGWGNMAFSSWEDGIWTVSAGMAKYYSLGLDTPAEISYTYCPPSSQSWGNNVQYVMNEIENM
jgi:hypothetical protein